MIIIDEIISRVISYVPVGSSVNEEVINFTRGWLTEFVDKLEGFEIPHCAIDLNGDIELEWICGCNSLSLFFSKDSVEYILTRDSMVLEEGYCKDLIRIWNMLRKR